jgi:hypothetical protein
MVNIVVRSSKNDEKFSYMKVHRHLLSNRSEYFKSMFLSNFSESTSNSLEIEEINDISLYILIKVFNN